MGGVREGRGSHTFSDEEGETLRKQRGEVPEAGVASRWRDSALTLFVTLHNGGD